MVGPQHVLGIAFLLGLLGVFAWGASEGRFSFTGAGALTMAVFMAGVGAWTVPLGIINWDEQGGFAVFPGLVSLAGGAVLAAAVLREHPPTTRRALYLGALPGVAGAAWPFFWSIGPLFMLLGGGLLLYLAAFDPPLRMLPGEE